MCSIKDCDGKPIAKGLCPKHYMRLRRTGSPDTERKPGRPPVPLREAVVDMRDRVQATFSKRTLQRYTRALRLLDHFDKKTRLAILEAASRPSGKLSFAKLVQKAEIEYVLKYDLHVEDC